MTKLLTISDLSAHILSMASGFLLAIQQKIPFIEEKIFVILKIQAYVDDFKKNSNLLLFLGPFSRKLV
ncbi:hypothetical protein, partial [Oenococcus oeni]